MTGYSGTPVWKKLGYKNGMPAYIDGGPSNYLSLVGLPIEVTVTWLDHAKSDIEFVHLFATSAAKLESKLRFYRQRIAPGGVIWVSWPKKSSGVNSDVTENGIRDAALAMGLVDVKVCAINEVWSGLKLVIRKAKRGAS
jgi:hypothetical protein